MQIKPNISKNFETAKVVAILVVTCGHFLPFDFLWVLASIALCIFGFSSGYFTACIYGDVSGGFGFFRNKILRLGPDLIAINLFLLALFIVQDRPNIFSWHSLIGVFGLTGWLNWLRIPNLSPFGAGLWYFSLLLVFYLVYPLLSRVLRHGAAGALFTFLLMLFALVLSGWVRFGHMLWFTAFSFCFGVSYAKQNWQVNIKNTILLVLAMSLAFFMARFFVDKPFGSLALVALISLLSVQILMLCVLPDWVHSIFKPLSACVLEIYFLHIYLFVHPAGNLWLDLIVSVGLVVLVSLSVRRVAEWIYPAFFQVISKAGRINA